MDGINRKMRIVELIVWIIAGLANMADGEVTLIAYAACLIALLMHIVLDLVFDK